MARHHKQSGKHSSAPVALVTGAAKRIGAAIARELHASGWRVAVHYRRSATEAQALVRELNATRADSVQAFCADLNKLAAVSKLVTQTEARWGRLDALVNNASSYYRTPLQSLDARQFDELVGSNLRAPLFLAQAFAAATSQGAIVNIIDVHARRPVAGFSAYLAAKSGLVTLTEALALELAPAIRVNAVAPGHMLWAEDSQLSAAERRREQARIPLQRTGQAEDIARSVRWLLSDEATYLTGAVIPVDGGLRLR